jgi:general secretion pathway protein G
MYFTKQTTKLDRASEPAALPVRGAKAGYSLLEILIVLAIIALIAALVGPRLFAQFDHAKDTTARVQDKALETALQTMELDIGRYPTSAEGLQLLVEGDRKSVAGWNGPYLSGRLPLDPWGHPYVYDPATDPNHPPHVHSLGAGKGETSYIYAEAPPPKAP